MAAEKHVKEVLSVMLNQPLDVFDLKKIQVNATKAELETDGKLQRRQVPVEKLGEYVPVQRDPINLIKLTEAKMIPELLPLRHQRMAASRFAFFRGTAELMEQDLKQQYQSGISIIINGDAHLGNYGFYASPERKLLFDLNDFDESRIGNWESDLKRLLVSTYLVGLQNNFEPDRLQALLSSMCKVYRRGVKHAETLTLLQRFYFSYEIHDMIQTLNSLEDNDRAEMSRIVDRILKKSHKNNSETVIKKFTTLNSRGHLIFRENPPRARHVSDHTFRQIQAAYNSYRNYVREDIRVLLASYHLSDVIRYSVSVGSFGTRCFLLLLTGIDGSHLVLQMKEALPLRYNLLAMPVAESIKSSLNAGRRIVTAQKVLQSASDPFLGSTHFDGRGYYLRQFRDMKESIDATRLDFESLSVYAEICSFLLAMAHFQSPTAPRIAGYLRKQKQLDEGLANWAVQYSKQVDQDYQRFLAYLNQ